MKCARISFDPFCWAFFHTMIKQLKKLIFYSNLIITPNRLPRQPRATSNNHKKILTGLIVSQRNGLHSLFLYEQFYKNKSLDFGKKNLRTS